MEIGISLNSFRDKRVLYNGACNGKYEIVSLGRPFFFFLQFPATNFILERLSLCLERIKRIWNATFGWNVSRDRHVCETQVCRNIEVFLKNPFSFWNTIGISFLFVYSILGASWNFVANLSCETIEIVFKFQRHFVAKKGIRSVIISLFLESVYFTNFYNNPLFGKLIRTIIMIFRRVTRGENCYYFVELLTCV